MNVPIMGPIPGEGRALVGGWDSGRKEGIRMNEDE